MTAPREGYQTPALVDRLRLLEWRMGEIQRRLEHIETCRPFTEALAMTPLPAHALRRTRQAIELPCHTCQAFKTVADGWSCDRYQPEFPYLCDHYSP